MLHVKHDTNTNVHLFDDDLSLEALEASEALENFHKSSQRNML